MSDFRVNMMSTAANTTGVSRAPRMMGGEMRPLFESVPALRSGVHSRGLVAPRPEPQDMAVFSTVAKN